MRISKACFSFRKCSLKNGSFSDIKLRESGFEPALDFIGAFVDGRPVGPVWRPTYAVDGTPNAYFYVQPHQVQEKLYPIAGNNYGVHFE